ncbi:MAG: M23 family metallopeptidase [Treponema sp.]|jgi:murein DD-endopeptidase MepM/ murein hydrolase activator NlpD|nr:M23 family metallopeptidase [Treponema sp.]
MSELVSKQHIKHRMSSPLASRNHASGGFSPANLLFPEKKRTKPAFRPEGILNQVKSNKKLIEGIKQKPFRTVRPVFTARSKQSPLRGKIFRGRGAGIPARRENQGKFFRAPPPSGAPRSNSGNGGGVFKIISPLVPLLGFSLLLLGAVAVLTWEREAAPSWFPEAVVSVAPDEGGAYNMALYAGIIPHADGTPGEDEEIPLDLVESLAWKDYIVKEGDSVSKISAEHFISMDAIIASNGISNARRIREGDRLRIPNMDGIPYTVKKGDSFSRISGNFGVPLEAILDANNVQSDIVTPGTVLFIPGARMKKEDLKLALGELFIYPLTNFRLSSPFGWRHDPISGVRRHHAAVDMAAPSGTSIKSVMDGRVASIGYNSVYGNFIILSHDGGYQTLYAHLSAVTVKKDGRVIQGAKIGEVGNTGYSTGPHLHFAAYKNGRAINPMDILTP